LAEVPWRVVSAALSLSCPSAKSRADRIEGEGEPILTAPWLSHEIDILLLWPLTEEMLRNRVFNKFTRLDRHRQALFVPNLRNIALTISGAESTSSLSTNDDKNAELGGLSANND